MKLKKLTLISLSRTDRKTYNKAKHSDSFFVAASPPLQSCACWRRYVADMSPDEEVHKKRIEIALDICQLNSGCRPFDIAKDQLDFLWAFLQGHESNMELLAKINLGLLAAREFEVRDMRLAELIYEIESTKDYLLQRGPRNAT